VTCPVPFFLVLLVVSPANSSAKDGRVSPPKPHKSTPPTGAPLPCPTLCSTPNFSLDQSHRLVQFQPSPSPETDCFSCRPRKSCWFLFFTFQILPFGGRQDNHKPPSHWKTPSAARLFFHCRSGDDSLKQYGVPLGSWATDVTNPGDTDPPEPDCRTRRARNLHILIDSSHPLAAI
jgi:hypothetical protein